MKADERLGLTHTFHAMYVLESTKASFSNRSKWISFTLIIDGSGSRSWALARTRPICNICTPLGKNKLGRANLKNILAHVSWFNIWQAWEFGRIHGPNPPNPGLDSCWRDPWTFEVAKKHWSWYTNYLRKIHANQIKRCANIIFCFFFFIYITWYLFFGTPMRWREGTTVGIADFLHLLELVLVYATGRERERRKLGGCYLLQS